LITSLKTNKRIHFSIFLCVIMALLFPSCKEGSTNSATELKFDLTQLEGTWLSDGKDSKDRSSASSSVEIWKVVEDGKIMGSDLVIFNQNDTVVIANLTIQKKDSVWINDVAVNPNTNAVAVPFRLESSSHKEMKFKNAGSGSPEFICYQLMASNKLLVYLESSSKSGSNRTEFHYSRGEK
jgi:hypothetical protein